LEKKELSRFNMLRTTSVVLDENRSVLASNPALIKKVDGLGNAIIKIENLDNDYQSISKGITSRKEIIKIRLAKLTDNHCGELHNLAEDTGDSNLQELSKVSFSVLVKLPNTELLLKCQAVHKLLRANAAALVDYDVSAGEIDEFDEMVKSYDDALKKKENKSDDSSIARAQLTAAFADATKLLASIDKSMKKAETKYPELHGKYLKARAVTDLGVRHEAEIVEVVEPAPVAG
jgi:hypothetical protein